MRTARRGGTALVDLVGLALLAAGPVMVVRAAQGRQELRAELDRQRIEFPENGRGLPVSLRHLAGRRVRTGSEALAYSELIKSHLDKATGGRTYAQISAEISAGDRDEKLLSLQQTAFMGETLRASLMGAYQASNIVTLVVGLGALFTGVGASLLALAHSGHAGGRDV